MASLASHSICPSFPDSTEPFRFIEHHEALQGLRNSALFWAARAHVAGLVASGTSSLSPSSSLLLTLLTASPCLARVACGTHSDALIGALSDTVQQLAPLQVKSSLAHLRLSAAASRLAQRCSGLRSALAAHSGEWHWSPCPISTGRSVELCLL